MAFDTQLKSRFIRRRSDLHNSYVLVSRRQ